MVAVVGRRGKESAPRLDARLLAVDDLPRAVDEPVIVGHERSQPVDIVRVDRVVESVHHTQHGAILHRPALAGAIRPS